MNVSKINKLHNVFRCPTKSLKNHSFLFGCSGCNWNWLPTVSLNCMKTKKCLSKTAKWPQMSMEPWNRYVQTGIAKEDKKEINNKVQIPTKSCYYFCGNNINIPTCAWYSLIFNSSSTNNNAFVTQLSLLWGSIHDNGAPHSMCAIIPNQISRYHGSAYCSFDLHYKR